MQRPKPLHAIERGTKALGFDMAIDLETGSLLRTLAASKPAARILELGTGTGASTAWLADGMDAGSELLSIDVDRDASAVAQEALSDDHRLAFRIIDGAAFLKAYDGPPFDLIFADAMPGKFETLDEALALVAPGGLYIVDDLLPQANWPENHQPRVDAFIARMKSEPGFRTTYLNWSTGILFAARIK
ncbi:MAG: O-methyltransferase [Alphaproteobacteria bacterium]